MPWPFTRNVPRQEHRKPPCGRPRREGLVARERDPSDSRSYLLGLTGEGSAAVARLAAARREGHAKLLAKLKPDEHEALLKGLDALVHALEDEDRSPANRRRHGT